MVKTIATALLVAAASVTLAAPASADYLFDVCPSGQSGIATTVTSCPFADSVRASFFAAPGTYVTAWSPVTGQVYEMVCNARTVITLNTGARLGVRCDGGNNAVVVFW